MVAPSLLSRLIDTLLHQDGENDPEIRRISLATLNDDDQLSTAALLWTQLGWFWVLSTTRWLWIFAFIAFDLSLFGIRWQLRRKLTPTGRPLDLTSETMSAWINLLLIASVSMEIFIVTQVPSERMAIYGIIIAVGFCGYVVSLFTAFPVLATVNIVMLNSGLALGLAEGFSDVCRPLLVLSIGVVIAFWLLMRRTHVNLLDSIRAQHADRQASLHDPLTKLPNRTFMRENLAHLLSIIGKPEGPSEVAVLAIDLDGFKGINDRYGHAAGDRVLIHVADILRQLLSSEGIPCRIGGDEYVILLPGWGTERIRSFSRSLIAAITQPFDIGRTTPAYVGVSVGVAVARTSITDLDELLEDADTALYSAKRRGKGRLEFGETCSGEHVLASERLGLSS